MSFRLIDANALNGVITDEDYEKVLNAPRVYADFPNGIDGGMDGSTYLVVPVYEGMTNGEMVQTMWNVRTWMYDKDNICVECEGIEGFKMYPSSWWNAFYKGTEE